MKNVLEWLEMSAHTYKNKAIYRDDNNTYTFGEVFNLAQRIGSALLKLQTSIPVVILAGRKIGTIVGYLGIVYSGHAYAPVDGTLPRKRIEQILNIIKPEAIIADSEFWESVQKYNVKHFKLEQLMNADIDYEGLSLIRENMIKTDPLYVIFTSGSSGKPKGVITSHESLMCYIESYAEVMNISDKDILGNQSPLDYIAAIRDIYLPLYKGATSVIIPKQYFMQPDELFDYMNVHEITCVGWSVSAFTVLLSLGAFQDKKLNTLGKICFSGSIMPMGCLKVWKKYLPDAVFVNQYGPTEATASCTYHIVSEADMTRDFLPVGKAYNNYRVFLLNDNLKEVKNGEIGEICISGPILALGYYRDELRTNQSFIMNPNNSAFPERIYRTGDYGRYDEHGELEFHGRMDRQIKHMGHRVELDEIECAAYNVDGIKECVSLYDTVKEKICLFYVGNVEKRSLAQELRNVLPIFMVPRKIERLDKIPKLPNGKIDTNMLKGEI